MGSYLILQLRKEGKTFEEISQQLNIKARKVYSEWVEINKLAQDIRKQ